MDILQNRIRVALGKFPGGDKIRIVEELVRLLELDPDDSLLESIESAMKRDLTPDERFRVDALELLRKDKGLSDGRGFPDGYGAPKVDK